MCLRSQRVPNVQSCSLIVSSPAAPSWQQTLQTRLLCIRGWMQQEFTASDVSVCLDAEEWFFWKVPLGFFFLLAQWKPVREVNSNSGSLHIKGSSEDFQSISLKKKHFYFLLRCFPWSSSSHCWFSVTPVLHSYWSDLAGTILVHACVSQTGNKGTAVQQEEFSYVLAASIVMTWIFEGW